MERAEYNIEYRDIVNLAKTGNSQANIIKK